MLVPDKDGLSISGNADVHFDAQPSFRIQKKKTLRENLDAEGIKPQRTTLGATPVSKDTETIVCPGSQK